MATEGIRLDDGGLRASWPLAVPRALLEAYQPLLGPTATLLWLNLYSLAEAPGEGPAGRDAPGAGLVDKLARRMGVEPAAVEGAAGALESVGLLRRTADGWVVLWPVAAPAVVLPGAGLAAQGAAAAAEGASAAEGAPAAEAVPAAGRGAGRGAGGQAARQAPPNQAAGGRGADDWDSMEAAMSAVVAFYHQRIGLLGPSQFERLRFWVEEQGMSPEVVAMAIEETVQSARTPRLNYLEGILRNWYNEGIRTLDDLQRSQRAKTLRQAAPVEGAPNSGAYRAVDAEAVKRWKEMFADEYDG